MTELTWRRFPLTRTSTWSGLKPLNWADLTISVWPELDWRGMLKEATAACNKPPSSPAILGDLTRSSAVMISTGTRLSSTARSWERVPMVTISSISSSAAEPDSCATGWNAQIDRDNRVTAGTVMRLFNNFIIFTPGSFLGTVKLNFTRIQSECPLMGLPCNPVLRQPRLDRSVDLRNSETRDPHPAQALRRSSQSHHQAIPKSQIYLQNEPSTHHP